MRKNEEDQGAKLIRCMSGILLGGALAVLVCLALLFLCSVGISGGWLSDRYMVQYTFAACVIGGLVGGLFAVLRCRTRTLLVGLGAGGVFFLLLLTISLLFYPGMSVENRGLGLLCSCLAGGALAGVLGGKPKKKRRKELQKRK